MKILFNISIFLVTINCYSQNLNFRKAILKSDLIVSSSYFRFDTISSNDFSKKTFVTIDSTDYVLRNNQSALPKKIIARYFQDDEDYFSDLIISGGGCVMNANEVHNVGQSYADVFFMKKTGKEYQVLMALRSIDNDKYNQIQNQVKTISKFEKVKTEKERFEKTLDWFIENGLEPDIDFISFYKQKNIIVDNIVYSETQIKNALEKFLNGKEELLPIVRIKHFDEVKKYYIEILQSLINKQELDWRDYYKFSDSINNLTQILDENSESSDYLLLYSLTNDKFEKYEKLTIMNHFLQVATDWTLE